VTFSFAHESIFWSGSCYQAVQCPAGIHVLFTQTDRATWRNVRRSFPWYEREGILPS